MGGYRPTIAPAASLCWRRVFAGLLAAAALSLPGFARAAPASLAASVEPATVSLGESARFSLVFSGGEPREIPSPPAVPGLQFSYIGRSSQISIANGQFSSITTHSFQVAAQRVGDFIIPAVRSEVNGQAVGSQAIPFKVLKPGAAAPGGQGATGALAFLRLIAPKTTAYEGEVLVLELQLLVRQGLRGVSQFQLTAFPAEGFTLGKIVEGKQQAVQVAGVLHKIFSWSAPLKADRAGKWTIGPVTASVVVELPGRRSRDPFFEQFGMRDPFGMLGGEQRQVALATEPVELTVKPLPSENVPPSFSGAVGSFTMEVSAGPTNVAVGDPITVKVQVSGRGSLDALSLSEQSWADFKTYPPTAKVDTTDPLGLQGSKTFEQVVVAEKPDITKLPPVHFSFFDPEEGKYRTLSHPALPLVVRPAAALGVPTIAAANQSEEADAPKPRDIVHIKPRLGALVPADAPLFRRGWFIALQALPLLAFAASLVWRRRLEQLARNPRLRRRRMVAQLTRDGIAGLRRLAAENDSDAFFANVFRLLQERIGERLDLPSSSITEAVVEEQLRPRGAPESLLREVTELFQTCNLARYAPVRSSQELQAFVPRVESALHQLEEVRL